MSEEPRRRLPIFPLPGVVFLPETTLPLHIFEPRYRQMLADALGSDELIGIQLLKPGREMDEEGRPAVFAVGCAGQIVEHEALEDGRSNILLRGVFRYRIAAEPAADRPYRVADVVPMALGPLEEAPAGALSRRDLRRLLARSVERLALAVGRPQAKGLGPDLSDEGLVNEALSRLGLDAEDGYKLLTMDRLEERYAWAVSHIAGVQARVDMLAPYRRGDGDSRWN
jgi:Lon protease-like protein